MNIDSFSGWRGWGSDTPPRGCRVKQLRNRRQLEQPPEHRQGGAVVVTMSRSFLSEDGSAGLPSLISGHIPKSFTVTYSKSWSQAMFPLPPSSIPSSLCALSIQMASYLDILLHHRGPFNLESQEICSFCDG